MSGALKITEVQRNPRRFDVSESFVCGRCGYAMEFALEVPRPKMRLPIVVGAGSSWPRERRCPVCRAKERNWVRVVIES